MAERGIGRLNVLDLQILMRRIPKPIVAMVAGYAIGGGHILHLVCDLTIAADNARFGQTGPKVGSFDGGYGSSILARTIGLKRAKEVWFLCRQYDAAQALEWGLVNTVVPLAELERETVAWCRQMLTLSPIALRMIKAGMNAADDGLAGRPAARRRRHDALLHDRGGPGGPERLRGAPAPDFSRFPAPPVSPPLKLWVAGARPRTLPAAVVPVAVGTAAGYLSSGACRRHDPQNECMPGRGVHRLRPPPLVAQRLPGPRGRAGDPDRHELRQRLRRRGARDRRAPGRTSPARRGWAGHRARGQGRRARCLWRGRAWRAWRWRPRVTWWLVPLGLVCGLAGGPIRAGPGPTGTWGSVSYSSSCSSASWRRRDRPTCSTRRS